VAEQRRALAQLEARIHQLEMQRTDIKARLAEIEDKTHHIPPDSTSSSAAKVRDQLQMLAVDRAALEARRDAIAQVIQELTKKADQSSQNDPVAAELESLLKIQEERYAMIIQQVKSGTLAQDDQRSAQAALSEAKVKLLERREAATRAVTGDALDEMNKWLLKTTIDLAESQARTKMLEEQVKEVDQTAGLADQQRDLLHEQDRLQAEEDKCRAELDDLQRVLQDTLSHESSASRPAN
jgi:hypothetical protein